MTQSLGPTPPIAPLRRTQTFDATVLKNNARQAILWTDDALQRRSPNHAAPRALKLPTEPAPTAASAPHSDAAVGALSLPVGKSGTAKTLGELRRAVVSAQPTSGWASVRLMGAVARWHALEGRAQVPAKWHLSVLVHPESSATQAPSAAATQLIYKRLIKRGFATREVGPHTLHLGDDPTCPLAVISVGLSSEAPRPNPMACEQLCYDLGRKAWVVLPGLDEATAWHYAEAGFWRAPNDVNDEHDDGPLNAAEGLESLARSWRLQAAGYTPVDVLNTADLRALLVVVDQTPSASAHPSAQLAITREVHDLLAPELSQANSALRREQLALAAIALCYLGQALPALTHQVTRNPLFVAIDAFLRNHSDGCDAQTLADVALARALASQQRDHALLRLLLADVPLRAHTIAGLTEPMLRISLPRLGAHIFVAHLKTQDVVMGRLAGPPVDLLHVLQHRQNGASAVADLVGCPELASLNAGVSFPSELTHRWAQTISQLATVSWDSLSPNERSRIAVALALMSPQHIAALPAAFGRAISRDDIISVAQLSVTREWLQKPAQALLSAALRAESHAHGFAAEHVLALPVACQLLLLRACVQQNHASTKIVLQSCLQSPESLGLITQDDTLMRGLCCHSELCLMVAPALAQAGVFVGAAFVAWRKEVVQQRNTAAMMAYLKASPKRDAGYVNVLNLRTEHLRRTPCAQDALQIADAWHELARDARLSGRNDSSYLVNILQLAEAGVQPHMLLAPAPEQDNLWRELCLHVLNQAQNDADRATATRSLRQLTLPEVRGDALRGLLQRLSAQDIQKFWSEQWPTDVASFLIDGWQHLGDLSSSDATKLYTLLKEMRAHDVPQKTWYRCLAIGSHMLARAHQSILHFQLLNETLTDARSAHLLLQQLRAHATEHTTLFAWVKVIGIAADVLSYTHLEGNAEDTDFVKASFWDTWALHIAGRLLNPETSLAGPQSLPLQNAVNAVALMRFRDLFAPLNLFEPVLHEVTQAVSRPEHFRAALRFLTADTALLAGNKTAAANSKPSRQPVALWHAVLRAAPHAGRSHGSVKDLLAPCLDVAIDATTGLFVKPPTLEALTATIECADLLLEEHRASPHVVRRALQDLAAQRMDEDGLTYRFSVLQQHAESFGLKATEAPALYAANKVLQDMAQTNVMTADARHAHDMAASNVVRSLFHIPDSLDEKLRAQALADLVQNVRMSCRQDAVMWRELIHEEQPIWQNLPDHGAASLAKLAQHYAIDVEQPWGQRPSFSLDLGLMDKHLSLALQGAFKHHAGNGVPAVESLFHLQALFAKTPLPPFFRTIKRVVARLARDELFNQLMLSIIMVQFLKMGDKALKPQFTTWLFESLLTGAPISACHLGVALAIGGQKPTHLRELLRQGDKHMLREAHAFSQELKAFRQQAETRPDMTLQVAQMAHERSKELWPEEWPVSVLLG